MIDVHYLRIEDITESDIALVKEKMPLRYKKAKKFTIKEGFLSSIGVGILELRAYPGLKEKDIYYNKYDKPFIKDNDYLSISHDGGYVVLVKSDNLVGVDVCEIKNKPHFLLKKYFEDEIEWINEDPNERYYTIWAIKESITKAAGTGLATSPFSFNVMPVLKGEGIEVNGHTFYCRVMKKNGCLFAFSTTCKKDLYK